MTKEYINKTREAVEFLTIGLSKHLVDRVAEIIEEKILEQKDIDDELITKLEKEKASLILEVHNKNKRIAELKTTKK